MTYNEKRSLYESIMKKIAKEVKKQINENNSYHKDGTFDQLNDIINDYLQFYDEPKKGLFIKVSDSRDLAFAIRAVINNRFKHESFPVNDREKEDYLAWDFDYINNKNFPFIIIQEFENINKDAYPVIAELTQGELNGHEITPPVIIVSAITPNDKEFMKNFIYFEMKY